jgi:hypothetical protein
MFGIGASTLPFIVGVSIALVGLYFTIVPGKKRKTPLILPQADIAKTMAGTMAIMIGYGILLPFLGYIGSTLIATIMLLRVLSKYNWMISILIGITITVLLYLIFGHFVYVPFPKGLIWDI